MRLLVVGLDAEGRSYLASTEDIEPADVPNVAGVRTALLGRTTSVPPDPRPASAAPHIDVDLPAGQVRWLLVDHVPNQPAGAETIATVLHTTDTVDFVQVLEGTLELTLDDGVHELRPGDFLEMRGQSHAMRAGASGCRMVAVAVGTPPRDS